MSSPCQVVWNEGGSKASHACSLGQLRNMWALPVALRQMSHGRFDHPPSLLIMPTSLLTIILIADHHPHCNTPLLGINEQCVSWHCFGVCQIFRITSSMGTPFPLARVDIFSLKCQPYKNELTVFRPHWLQFPSSLSRCVACATHAPPSGGDPGIIFRLCISSPAPRHS